METQEEEAELQDLLLTGIHIMLIVTHSDIGCKPCLRGQFLPEIWMKQNKQPPLCWNLEVQRANYSAKWVAKTT